MAGKILSFYVSRATLADAIEWNSDPMAKFIFCADTMELSAIDDDMIIDRWVDRLEVEFERLLGDAGIEISE